MLIEHLFFLEILTTELNIEGKKAFVGTPDVPDVLYWSYETSVWVVKKSKLNQMNAL